MVLSVLQPCHSCFDFSLSGFRSPLATTVSFSVHCCRMTPWDILEDASFRSDGMKSLSSKRLSTNVNFCFFSPNVLSAFREQRYTGICARSPLPPPLRKLTSYLCSCFAIAGRCASTRLFFLDRTILIQFQSCLLLY